jgi:NAD(P) transhydrogenase subunit beta
MIQIPAMVAFQHGAGGVAAFLVSFVELTRDSAEVLSTVGEISGILGLIIGAATFSGSMVASGKLSERLRQTPVIFRRHNLILATNAAVIVGTAVAAGVVGDRVLVGYSLISLILLSVLIGVIFSIRIGGADMPVLISFLNATAGLAAAFCGIVIENRLLVACGATVAASGSILTYVMCKAMNRGLVGVFGGIEDSNSTGTSNGKGDHDPGAHAETELPITSQTPNEEEREPEDPLDEVVRAIREAESVIIVPGYGMALAEAEAETVRLSERMEEAGKKVRFAIHPVAGRMPGHMHVLLAEADIDYDKLVEMDDINTEFRETDLVLVIGACDVVNTAALESEGTPISGMPILAAHEAKRIVVCNLDLKPGYSGVTNPLYWNSKTTRLLGDARDNIKRILERLAA